MSSLIVMLVAVSLPRALSRFESDMLFRLGLMDATSIDFGGWLGAVVTNARAIPAIIPERTNLEGPMLLTMMLLPPGAPKVTNECGQVADKISPKP